MTDITGTYKLSAGAGSTLPLSIISVSAAGQLDGTLEGNLIAGQYDSTTNSMAFDVELIPGDPYLFATYYLGYAIGPPDGHASALAGTYNELTITVRPPGFKRVSGGWFAVSTPESGK
jgi:hypothetical protein